LLIRGNTGASIYLFGHDARDTSSRIVVAGKALAIEGAGLLLGELETDVLLIDWWTRRTVRATSSSSSKHETGSQLGTARRSQNFAMILLSESSKSWGGEALGKGATIVVLLLLAETAITLDLAVLVSTGIFSVFHHDTQVGSEVSERIVAIRGTE
jgi:hypothetical protein